MPPKTSSPFNKLVALLCVGVVCRTSLATACNLDLASVGEQHNRALDYLTTNLDDYDGPHASAEYVGEAMLAGASYLTETGCCSSRSLSCEDIAGGVNEFLHLIGAVDGVFLPQEQRVPASLEGLVQNKFMNGRLADDLLAFYRIVIEDDLMFLETNKIVVQDDLMFLYTQIGKVGIIAEDDLMFLYNHAETELERNAIAVFINVLLSSQEYWIGGGGRRGLEETAGGSRKLWPKWGKIFADAMGALHGAFWGGVFTGGNPIGLVGGAIVGGAAFSKIENQSEA